MTPVSYDVISLELTPENGIWKILCLPIHYNNDISDDIIRSAQLYRDYRAFLRNWISMYFEVKLSS